MDNSIDFGSINSGSYPDTSTKINKDMKQSNYNSKLNKIIKTSFYLTKFISNNDMDKADKMRNYLNRLIDESLQDNKEKELIKNHN